MAYRPVAALKKLIHSTLRRYGYAITRPTYGIHDDAFDAQRFLLGQRDVRVIFDVGSNLGQTALKYTATFPASVIYAFEPDRNAYADLARRTAGVAMIKPRNLAVSAESGTATLHVNVRSSTNSLFETSSQAGRFVAAELMEERSTVEVKTVTLADFCKDERIDQVDILKVDVQGAELLVLQGAEALLREAKIDLVYSEVLFAPLYERQAGFTAVHDHLSGFGYQLYGLYDLNYGKNGMLAWADGVWLSPRLADVLPRRES